MRRGRSGGILSGLLIAIVVGLFAMAYIAANIRVDHVSTYHGQKTRIETPLGDIGVDASDRLNPEVVGVPVYPGAVRDGHNAGGAVVNIGPKKFALAGASYTTRDSARQVRDFYHDRLPHWIFLQRNGADTRIEMSREGYKRIINIEERYGTTHIGVFSVGNAGVN